MGTPVPMAVENVPALMTDNVWDLSFTGFKPICKLPSYQTSSARSSSFVYYNHLESLYETMVFWLRLTSPEIKHKWAVRLRNVAPLSVVAWYTLIISPSWLTWCKNIIDDLHITATGNWATTHAHCCLLQESSRIDTRLFISLRLSYR